MKCLICNKDSYYYFEKRFDPPYDEYLGVVEYFKCPHCGFVFSKTHALLDQDSWEKLNHLYHTYIEDPETKKTANQPPYLEHAMLINVLAKNGLVSVVNAVDWGGGYGTLAKCLNKYFEIEIPVFEIYMQAKSDLSNFTCNNGVRYIPQDELSNYETVINSAVFEHVTKREHLDKINHCVANDGCLILHTVVCENIPQDPNWFYLLPVHCAFHTNRSMELLMQQWEYASSIYCPSAKSWVLVKQGNRRISQDSIKVINMEFQFNYLYYKKGFMDYWK